MVETVNKGFASYDAAVCEISGSISKSINTFQFKILLPFLVNPCNLSSLINKLPVILQPFLFTFHTKLPQTEIQRKKTVSIISLGMLPQGTPTILFWAFGHSRADRIQVDVSKTVLNSLIPESL